MLNNYRNIQSFWDFGCFFVGVVFSEKPAKIAYEADSLYINISYLAVWVFLLLSKGIHTHYPFSDACRDRSRPVPTGIRCDFRFHIFAVDVQYRLGGGFYGFFVLFVWGLEFSGVFAENLDGLVVRFFFTIFVLNYLEYKMLLKQTYFNELPFIIEMPDGKYEVKVNNELFELEIISNYKKLFYDRFPDHISGDLQYGTTEQLISFVQNQKIDCFSFAKAKTCVRFEVTKSIEISEEERSYITEEEVFEELKSQIIREHKQLGSEKLNEVAKERFEQIDSDIKIKLIENIIIMKHFKMFSKELYFEVVNKFISIYSYKNRNIFWIQKITRNTIQSANVYRYVDSHLWQMYKDAERFFNASDRKLFPDLTDEELHDFRNLLKSGFNVPPEINLITVAKSLWIRGENRSAVLESSAALEIAVEKKIREKMNLQKKTDVEIFSELQKTETNFRQRCEVFLKKHTGKSFVTDNSALWEKIDESRKKFRHKITHDSIDLDKTRTEEIIKIFEEGVNWVMQL
jgi:hypothetical protein